MKCSVLFALPLLAQSECDHDLPFDCNCADRSYGPVTAGVDYVEMFQKVERVDIPEFGSSQFTATLNGYTFWFKSAENQAKFIGDPWTYAPNVGGFCSFGMSKGHCQPGVDIWAPVFNTGFAHMLENRTFMQYGVGPVSKFASESYAAALPGVVALTDAKWENCFGSDRSEWPFNTACCVSSGIERECNDPPTTALV